MTDPPNFVTPFRCLLLGATSRGRFQLELLESRPEFELVGIACVAGGVEDFDLAQSLPCGADVPVVDDPVAMPGVDLLIVADVCAESLAVARRFVDVADPLVEAGGAVLLIPPFRTDSAALNDLVAAGERAGAPISVWRPLRHDPDASKARMAARSDETGTLRAIRCTLHEMAAELLPPLPVATGSAAKPGRSLGVSGSPVLSGSFDVLNAFVEPRLDVLIGLAGSDPVRVFSRLSRAVPEFNRDTSSRLNSAAMTSSATATGSVTATGSATATGSVTATATDSATATRSATATGCLATIEFQNGVVAQLDVDLAAPARLATGWTLQGARGGYATGRQFCSAPDGELFDVPLETVPGDPYAEILGLLRRRLDQKRRVASVSEPAIGTASDWPASAAVAVACARLLEAIRQAEAGPVSLLETPSTSSLREAGSVRW